MTKAEMRALLAPLDLDGTEPSLLECDTAAKRHIWPMADISLPTSPETLCRCGSQSWGLRPVGHS